MAPVQSRPPSWTHIKENMHEAAPPHVFRRALPFHAPEGTRKAAALALSIWLVFGIFLATDSPKVHNALRTAGAYSVAAVGEAEAAVRTAIAERKPRSFWNDVDSFTAAARDFGTSLSKTVLLGIADVKKDLVRTGEMLVQTGRDMSGAFETAAVFSAKRASEFPSHTRRRMHAR